MPPVVSIIKFQKVHPDNRNLPGYLHTNKNAVSDGFIRGTGLDVGHFLLIYTKSGSKAWVGWLTEHFPNDGDGEGWYFSVLNTKDKSNPGQGIEEVMVTVVNPAQPTQPSTPYTAPLSPDVVP